MSRPCTPPQPVMEPAERVRGAFWADGLWRYGLLGLPLAFVALPLYVLLPQHYAQRHGMPLAAVGLLLLTVRALDAFLDPWFGRCSDRWFAHSPRAVWHRGCVAALCLVACLWLVYFPPTWPGALWGAGVWLALFGTCAAFSVLSIAHQAWGARLGGNAVQQGRVVGWREGAGVVGVVLASALSTTVGPHAMLVVFGVATGLACWAWGHAPQPQPGQAQASVANRPAVRPWGLPAFTGLWRVFVINGVAAAVPATLVLFFLQDRLQVPAPQQAAYLSAYFLAAAIGLPLWLRGVRRWGLVRCWLSGMVLSVLTFAWAAWLQADNAWLFALVCLGAGLALGADLVMPGALLARVLEVSGERDAMAGACFGWWNLAAKLNLALAAGLALPLLAWWGYVPGERTEQGLRALTWAYAVLPCALKVWAAVALYRRGRRHDPEDRT